MRSTPYPITQTMIDLVFSNPHLTKMFANPKKAQAVCEMRVAGATYEEIGKKHKVSPGHCVRLAHKLHWIYQLYHEGEQT